jgi:hypothetical protein
VEQAEHADHEEDLDDDRPQYFYHLDTIYLPIAS